MSAVDKLVRAWREGTLGEKLSAKLGRMPVSQRVRWLGARRASEAVAALTQWGRLRQREAGGWLLLLGDNDVLTWKVIAGLQRAKIPQRLLTPAAALALPAAEAAQVAAVLCTYVDASRQTAAARQIAAHAPLAEKPFEYVYGLDPALVQFHQRDEYASTDFVSPLLLDAPTPHAIYEESLKRFEQKCGLRDYLDLYQVLRHIVHNRIPGDIAEFGSYKGHSGWLIARSLEALGDGTRRVFLFDTFAGFPEEKGLDHFWSDTHKVDFESIRVKFADRANVKLVRGDFTQTLPASDLGQLALAYVDCDSYRATRWLIQTLWPQRISPRGAMVFEDYGHPALLGNRVAIHEDLPESAGGIRHYSQFSGLYIAYNA
ncbi:MAG: TylF/MycF/NovP-related O-methyltransferase [Stenotrophobium sp.]